MVSGIILKYVFWRLACAALKAAFSVDAETETEQQVKQSTAGVCGPNERVCIFVS